MGSGDGCAAAGHTRDSAEGRERRDIPVAWLPGTVVGGARGQRSERAHSCVDALVSVCVGVRAVRVHVGAVSRRPCAGRCA